MKTWKSSWLIFLLFVNACGPVTYSIKKHKVDQEFIIFVENFESEIGKKVDIDIRFNTLEKPTVGVCIKYSNSEYNHIEVDPEFWFKISFDTKEQLLFHELGHCILNRQHTEKIIEYSENKLTLIKIPKSIMYPTLFESYYEQFRNYYVNELKNSKINLTDYSQLNNL